MVSRRIIIILGGSLLIVALLFVCFNPRKKSAHFFNLSEDEAKNFVICDLGSKKGELDAGRRACDLLLSNPLHPDLERQTRSNRLRYQTPLNELVDCSFQRINVKPAHRDWTLFNPTILVHGDELLAVVRSSNYRLVNGIFEIPPLDNQKVKTENFLIRFTSGLNMRDCKLIKTPNYLKTEYPVDGLEDCRLRHTKHGIGVSATVRNVAPFDGRCRIGIADLNPENAELSQLCVLDLNSKENEKNWMPIEGGELDGRWIYSVNHLGHTVTVDDNMLLHYHAKAPHITSNFRGGGQVIAFNDGYLGVIHEVAFFNMENQQICYEHRFVWFDNSLSLKRMSHTFAFLEPMQIEFASGLALFNNQIIVSFGVGDAEAWLVSINADKVKKLLLSLEFAGEYKKPRAVTDQPS
jgi:hypothetical protein